MSEKRGKVKEPALFCAGYVIKYLLCIHLWSTRYVPGTVLRVGDAVNKTDVVLAYRKSTSHK